MKVARDAVAVLEDSEPRPVALCRGDVDRQSHLVAEGSGQGQVEGRRGHGRTGVPAQHQHAEAPGRRPEGHDDGGPGHEVGESLDRHRRTLAAASTAAGSS